MTQGHRLGVLTPEQLEHARAEAAKAPPLTDEQIRLLREAMRPTLVKMAREELLAFREDQVTWHEKQLAWLQDHLPEAEAEGEEAVVAWHRLMDGHRSQIAEWQAKVDQARYELEGGKPPAPPKPSPEPDDERFQALAARLAASGYTVTRRKDGTFRVARVTGSLDDLERLANEQQGGR